MKAKTWILIAAIGIVLVVVGLVLADIIVWQNQNLGFGFTIPVATRPFNTIGFGLAIGGGILIVFSIIGFIIKYSKESEVEATLQTKESNTSSTTPTALYQYSSMSDLWSSAHLCSAV